MVNALKNIAIGLVIFVVADQLIGALITGESTSEILIQTLVPLAIGIGVAIYAIISLLGIGTKGGSKEI